MLTQVAIYKTPEAVSNFAWQFHKPLGPQHGKGHNVQTRQALEWRQQHKAPPRLRQPHPLRRPHH